MKTGQIAGLIVMALLGYVMMCSLQMYLIMEQVGLKIPFGTVVMSTIKMIFVQGPWVPFVMLPIVEP